MEDHRPRILVQRIHPLAMLPSRAYPSDAGMDLFVPNAQIMEPGHNEIQLGIAVYIPEGFWGRLTGRSSARRRGLFVYDAVIDAGYTGELICHLYNEREHQQIHYKERIAQLIIHSVIDIRLEETIMLPDSIRGDRGFGSSGL